MPSLTTSRFVLTLILVAGSVVALVSLSPSTTQAQNPDDDEYAHVKGQDEYGPTYEVKQVPSQMRRALDAQGKCTVPSFINATMERDGSQCWVISQIPAAGTVITGPQSVTVQLEYTCNGVDTFWARLLVDAVDATPPTLAVQVQGDGQEPQTAPSGIRYFRSPVTLAVNAVTADNVDGARNAPHPDISIEVGCEVIPGVLELTEPGYYTLAVKAIDSSGNSTYYTELVEVRQNRNVAAGAAIEALAVTNNGATDLVQATVLLTSAQADPCFMNLSTLAVWLFNAEGQAVGGAPLRMSPGYVVGGSYNPALAQLDECVWRLAMQAEVPAGSVTGQGMKFAVTGSGLHGNPEVFDFVTAKQQFAPQTDAEAVLRAQIGPICPCVIPPPPPPPPPCEWKSQFIPDEDDLVSEWESGVCGGHAIWLKAEPTSISGSASASDHCWDWPVDSSVSGSVASGATFKVFLEPQDCCTDCTISIVARPKFKAEATINPPASAVAGGYISVATPCGNTEAIGGVAVGDFDTTTIEIGIGDYTIPIPVSEGEQSGQQVFQGNLSCVVNACSVDVSIATGAYLSANANATIINWFADAMARVFGSQVGLTVTPNAGPACNVVNDSTPFKVGVCANETP